MNLELLNDSSIAIISSDEPIITDVSSALDLAMTVRYQMGASRFAIDKRAVCEDFFVLSTGLAGEVLQRLVNYHMKAAIYGDYTHYTSKPLQDFIRESNRGKDFFFVATKEDAIRALQNV